MLASTPPATHGSSQKRRARASRPKAAWLSTVATSILLSTVKKPKKFTSPPSRLAWSLYPLAYFGYALLRGEWIGFYPYPFIDVTALGYARVLGNALVMLVAFLLLGLGVIGLDRWQGRRLACRP